MGLFNHFPKRSISKWIIFLKFYKFYYYSRSSLKDTLFPVRSRWSKAGRERRIIYYTRMNLSVPKW